jgi:SAM-dependent methyltransferase
VASSPIDENAAISRVSAWYRRPRMLRAREALLRPILPPVPALAGDGVRLFLTSATLLFVELLLIRWIPANVRYIGFFSNFVLIGSFLGIGLGILAGRHAGRATSAPIALPLLLVVLLVVGVQLNVQVRSQTNVYFGLAESNAADVNFLVLPLIFVLTVATMALLALPLGRLLRSMPPLQAYGVDILGSMAGIAAFTGLSALGTDPTLWFGLVAILVGLLTLGSGVTLWSAVSAVSAVAIVVVSLAQMASGDVWSPYYRVSTYPGRCGFPQINVNGIPHQVISPVDDASCPMAKLYDQVYEWFPGRTFPRVLVVGAGTGSDVALALARGAQHVDAVEIDPEIQSIGAEQHPDRPYQSTQVSVTITDGRAFLRNSTDRYDLVVFALPDSLTLVSTSASLRLESFLFTDEAFASVREHLEPNGVFVMYNDYRQPWLVAKLDRMLTQTFGTKPLLRIYERSRATFASGPAVASLAGGTPLGDRTDPVPRSGGGPVVSATDDWPFLYVRQPSVARFYVATLAFMLIFALLSVLAVARRTATPIRRFSPHFFVLGAAFLLLETRSIVSFSLLFGTTWIVNALTFFAILASVLLGIAVNLRFPIRRKAIPYGALLVTLLVAFLLPPESLLIDPPVLRYVLASAVAFAPVFLANIIFTNSFRDTATADMAFASNLLGAVAGGTLEYLALVTGYRALLIVVALLYVGAFVLATRFRLLADAELEGEPVKAVGVAASPADT